MAERMIPTNENTYMPIIYSYYTKFKAEDYIGDKFEDSQEFAEQSREIALNMLARLQAMSPIRGFTFSGQNIEFDAKPPEVDDITIPAPPDSFSIPAFTGEFPDIDHIMPPTMRDPPVDLVYDDDVLERIKFEVMEGLKDPTGYSPPVEQAIYDRARSRRRADLEEKKEQVASDLAKRDFPAPPGTLHALRLRYDTEDHREEANLERDIAQQQADLARGKWELLLQTGVNVDQALRERAVQKAQTAMEKYRLSTQFALDHFASRLRWAEAKGGLLQSEVQLYGEKARVESLKFEAYRSQIQGVQSRAELDRIRAQIFSEVRQAEYGKYQLLLEQDRLNLEHTAREAEHKRSIAEQTASVAAQLAASAMTAVNTTASLSGAQSDSNAYSYSASVSRNDGISYSYTGGVEDAPDQ